LLEDAYPEALRRGQAELRLRVGGGRAGNVGAWCRWEPAGDAKAPDAINVVPGEGGADPEALIAAQQRSAGRIRQITRAVLAADFETIATGVAGVAIARAHAAVSFHPDFPCLPVPGVVTVFIVPQAPRDSGCGSVTAPVPDTGALAAVAASLEAARIVGTEIVVRPPIYVTVRLAVDVQANSAAPDMLRTRIQERLAGFLDPLTGGGEGIGWVFGEKLRPSTLLRQAQDAVDGAAEVTRVAITLPGARPPVTAETCRDVEIGVHALPALTEVAVRIAAPAQPPGGLT
jgi:predicted phage baseplate assembly protein